MSNLKIKADIKFAKDGSSFPVKADDYKEKAATRNDREDRNESFSSEKL